MPSMIHSEISESFSTTVAWQDFAYAFVESPVEVRLLDLSSQQFVPESYDTGILFGKEAELRWRRRRSGLFHIVLIHDRGKKGEPLEPGAKHNGLEHIVLWGEPQGGASPPTWYEPRIPRMISDYPGWLKGKRVAVSLKRYRLLIDVPQPGNPASIEKAVTLLRCVDLIEAPLED